LIAVLARRIKILPNITKPVVSGVVTPLSDPFLRAKMLDIEIMSYDLCLAVRTFIVEESFERGSHPVIAVYALVWLMTCLLVLSPLSGGISQLGPVATRMD